MLDEQILPPIAVGEAGAPGRTQKAVEARNIRAFLSALSASARIVDAVALGSVPIAKAADKTKTSRVDVVHLVLGGYLSNVIMLSTMEGYAAVHVDPAEVREKLDEHLCGVSISVVAARMHLPTRTVWVLLDEREGGALLASTVVHAPNGRHSFRRIMPKVIERFQDTYATSVQIVATLQVDRRELERDIRSARIRPAISSADLGVDFYRREDLPVRLLGSAEKIAAQTEAPPIWAALLLFRSPPASKVRFW